MDEQSKRELLRLNFLSIGEPQVDPRELAEAMYSIVECGMWPDSVEEQAILGWQVVEKLRSGPFPKNLRM